MANESNKMEIESTNTNTSDWMVKKNVWKQQPQCTELRENGRMFSSEREREKDKK